jgi:hypothetical protein
VFCPPHLLTHLVGLPSLNLSCHLSDLKDKLMVCAKFVRTIST